MILRGEESRNFDKDSMDIEKKLQTILYFKKYSGKFLKHFWNFFHKSVSCNIISFTLQKQGL